MIFDCKEYSLPKWLTSCLTGLDATKHVGKSVDFNLTKLLNAN